MLPIQRGRGKGDERLAEAVCQIRPDAAPGEDAAGGIGRNAEGNAKQQGNKPSTFEFLGLTYICARSRRGKFTVQVRTMPKRLSRSLTAVARWCQEHHTRRWASSRKPSTLNALPVLRTTDELPQFTAVLSGSPSSLAEVAQSSHSWEVVDVGEILGPSPSPSSVASSHHALRGYDGEFCLRNPLREICTAGSVRGEIPKRLRST